MKFDYSIMVLKEVTVVAVFRLMIHVKYYFVTLSTAVDLYTLIVCYMYASLK